MSLGRRLLATRKGSAAAEMALVTPLLLALGLGSVELGNYFYNAHLLAKAVRDGARYAARQSFTLYPCGGTMNSTVTSNTKTLVMTSLLANGSNRLANWNANSITVSFACSATATASDNSVATMGGIYSGSAGGAPVVTVSATVPYSPVIGAAFGFSGSSLNLNAAQQAAVAGI